MYNCQSPLQMASSQERCPVCRLFLLPDMLLSEHLDTHPKDQVILALTNLLDRQSKNSSRSSSPWMNTTKTTPAPSLIVNPPHAPDNQRQLYLDTPERTPGWQKLPQSWSYSPRYSNQNPSPRYTQWQGSQNSTYVNDLRYDITPINPQLSYNDIPNNQIQFATPVAHKPRSAIPETSPESLILSSTIPVIQRNDNLNINVELNQHQSSPACIYRSINYIENQNTCNRLKSAENGQNADDVSEQRLCINENSIVTEPVVENINNINSTCNNNGFDSTSLNSLINSNTKSARKEVIIQPEKLRTVSSDGLSCSLDIDNKNTQNEKQTDDDVYLDTSLQHNTSNDTRFNLIVAKPGLTSKSNIEILSHSVINNSKLLKKPEVKKLIIDQKKNETNISCDIEFEAEVEEIQNESNGNFKLVAEPVKNETINLKEWNMSEQEENEIKIFESEKSYDNCSEQDMNFETDQRRTVFSPNLVVINLEENSMNSTKKLLDIDAYQQDLDNRSVYEFSKNFNQDSNFPNTQYESKSYSAQIDFKEEISHSKASGSTSFQSQTDFSHTDGQMDDFSSHSSSKLNNCDNFRQNLEHSLSSESLNIRTDEKMPARGELSEQESTDSSTWAYQNACSSFPLNMPVDGNELNLSQYLSPILEPSSSCSSANQLEGGHSSKSSSTSKQQNIFKCPHCIEEFLCAKERRVHISRNHPSSSGPTEFSKNHKDTLRNSFHTTEEINSYNKDIKVISQTNCDNFDGSLLVSSMNIINNNTDVVLEPLGKIDLELKSADIETDFNLFNLNQNSSFTESNVKIEDNFSGQSTSKDVKIIVKQRKTNRKKFIRYTYTCIICQEEFNTLSSFNSHLQKHPLECRICAKLFLKKQSFDAHEARHLGYKNHACTQCSRRFYTEQKLKEHEHVHTNSQTYKCTMCEAKFRRPNALAQHKLSVHMSKPSGKVYFCHCGENFPSLAKLYYHKETHDTKPKNCKYCTQKFVHLISLNRHIRISHNDKMLEDTEVCQVCNKNLSKLSMRTHMKLHTGKLTHNCFICNKNFSTKWNLKLHKFVHQNRSTKPFKCNICPSAFLRMQDYKYHMNSHKKIYSFVCNHCGRKFIRKYNYLRHVKEHSQEKKYQCTVSGCTKVFHRKYYLTEHLRTHTGMRPYTCTICSKTSSTKSNHNKHLKIHHANTRDSINMEN